MNHKCNLLSLVLGILFTSFLLSCGTTQQMVYFQGDTARYVPLKTIQPQVVRIQSSDILSIAVSSLSEESNKIFELPNTAGLHYTSFPGASAGQLQPLGYEVDSLGQVEAPLIGLVKLGGSTPAEAAAVIKKKLSVYLKEPTVNVRILNHRFTMLGEVNKPGTYSLLDNRTSIISALGMAGDLTTYAQRQNIVLIREENGKREEVRLNLLSQSILNSPYYYLRNGDIIYVEPSRVKANYNDRTYQMVPIATTILSAVISVAALIINLAR
jgi:polysaccharide export outer membrane protein